ncbi:helix-turn-helix transcriptional regulator [Paenibacillus sp. EPM92]|uniref:helix-turn-helix transcriptional regulator n=1 Tax=Paenibacillus sp. EPM92 TaxID=1561195 RepID=UPI001915D8C7
MPSCRRKKSGQAIYLPDSSLPHVAAPKGTFNLTPREREIALSSMTCSSIAEMAEQLHVTEITVKKHLGRIYEKAGVKGKTELIKKLMSL